MKLFFLLLLVITTPTFSNQCKVNGCGSGMFTELIPNEIRSLDIDFTHACNNHDHCYSKCISNCSETTDFVWCSIEETIKIKKNCDLTFRQEMRSSCLGKYDEKVCNGVASVYYNAVKLLGSYSIKVYEDKSLLASVIDKKSKEVTNKAKRILSSLYKEIIIPKTNEQDDWFAPPINDESSQWFSSEPKETKNTLGWEEAFQQIESKGD